MYLPMPDKSEDEIELALIHRHGFLPAFKAIRYPGLGAPAFVVGPQGR